MAPKEEASHRTGGLDEGNAGAREALDGRTARKQRNREAVIDAMLDAIEGGELQPGVQRIAEVSGVSERSVFRYFADLDELLVAAFDRGLERYEEYRKIENQGIGSLSQRINSIINQRLRFWVHAGAASYAARQRAHQFVALKDGLKASRQRTRLQLEDHFSEELSRMTPTSVPGVVMLVEILLSNESFRLMVEEGLSANEVRERWTEGLLALLAPEVNRHDFSLPELDLTEGH